MGKKFGTETNPIVLVPEVHEPTNQGNAIYRPRDELLGHTTLGRIEQNLSHLGHTSDESRFILNVISNPHLNYVESRIALFLYAKYRYGRGEFFLVSQYDLDMISFADLGEKDRFYSRKSHLSDIDTYFKSNIQVLSSVICNALNIAMSPPRLTGVLRKLHGFGYITLTDINYHNSQDGNKELKFSLKEGLDNEECYKSTSGRAMVKHIRVSEYLQRVDISKRWLWDSEAQE
ncbi:hypothetical protein [Shewanella sp. MEBiC00475]|uniref:hypothetical protein n=1 Tax=Shewanella sp. MEBiC00475 TaxID=2575361 RepID=UPI0010C0B731|nr:hypothetical protein [Shewanella sp. MEBiC00475]